ncbi:MAG: hypothetical protein KKB46_02430, partial [Candidatus Omnitrophica bacterium]|nr:hypothetical protein [Candidatus Omnitrophota bacterium]
MDMDKALRSILWILVSLVVLSSFSAGWFFVAKERLFDEYVSMEHLFKTSVDRLNRELTSVNKENVEIKSKLENVEKEFNILESRNKDLETKYTRLVKEKDDFTKELARVKKGKFYLENKLKEMESENFLAEVLKEKITMEVELDRLKDSLQPRYAEIVKLKAENMDMAVMLSRFNESKKKLEGKIGESNRVAEILSKDLLKEKDKNEQHRKEIEIIRINRDLLKNRLAEIEDVSVKAVKLLTEKEEILSKLSNFEREIEYKDREIDKLKIALTEQAGNTRELRAEAYHAPIQVELPPIVLQGEGRGATTTRSSSLERISEQAEFKGRIIT